MKIAFTGGGTIGHVAVNLAIMPIAIKRGYEVIYIGSKTGIEKEVVNKQFPNIKYIPISSGKLRRYLSVENVKDIFKVQKGVLDALMVLKKEQPDFIFSKGGFVSVPVAIAAKILNIKIIIHESDVTPGLANKISLKFATKLYTNFEETLKYVDKQKSDYVGSIIRDDLFLGNSQKGYELTGFNPEKKVLLIMGGSLGSKTINEVVRNNLSKLLNSYQIIHLTGKGLIDYSLKQAGYQQFEYVSDELMHLYAISDTIISRAGANSIYEFLALKKPMLLIPLGLDQSRGDQIENAKVFEKAGYAKVIQEEMLNSDSLLETLNLIEIERAEMIQKMSQNAFHYTPERLLDKMLQDIKSK